MPEPDEQVSGDTNAGDASSNTETTRDENGFDEATFEALDAYADRGEKHDDSLNPLFACLDRLGALGTDRSEQTQISNADSAAMSAHAGIPEMLGDYRIGACLGRGGMGVVFRGEHSTMGHAVAIKVIPADTATSTEVIERFYQEARAAAGEEHPNVVAVRHVGQAAGLHYLVMDLVEGTTLSERLLDGPLAWRDAVAMAIRVADAIQHLHDRGVVHRDLKPSNILLDQQGRPYVTDFGLAKLTNAVVKTQSRALVGTPRYMSPEQAAGKAKDVGPESDLFSLGTVLYECLVGRPAFDAEHPLDAVLQVIESEPPAVRQLDRSLPRDVERVVLRCLNKDRGRRYRSGAALIADLKACLAGEPISQQRVDPAAMARRALRRRPAILLRLFGIGAIAVLVQAAYLLGAISTSQEASLERTLQGRDPHYAVMSVLAGWLIGSGALHLAWVYLRSSRSSWLPFAWALVDAAFLTWTLSISEAPLQAPSIGYPCLIVVAGVWLRPGVVWFTAALAAAGYASLQISHTSEAAHYPLIFLAGLALVALSTAHQVQRVRWLTAVADVDEYLSHRK